MAATFDWCRDTGAAIAGVNFNKGTTRTITVSTADWMNNGTEGAVYSQAGNAITAGNNSFSQWLFARISGGTWTQIQNTKFAHTQNGPNGSTTGLTIAGPPPCTGSGTALLYNGTGSGSPSAGALYPGTLTLDMNGGAVFGALNSAVLAIGSGIAVAWTSGGPENKTNLVASPASGTIGSTIYTNYLGTQLLTTSGAAGGDIPTVTLTLRYDES